MFAAINPACFCDGFEDRLSDFMGMLRGLDPVSILERAHVAVVTQINFSVFLSVFEGKDYTSARYQTL